MRPLDVCAAYDLHSVHDAIRLLLEPVNDCLVNRLHRGGAERVAGMHAHRVDVLDRADGDHLSLRIADDFEFELFPAEHALFYEHLGNRACCESARYNRAQFLDVVYQPAACAAHGVCRAQHAGITELIGDGNSFLDGMRNLAASHLNTEFGHGLLEHVAVFSAFYCVYRRSDDFDAVLVKHA